MERTGRPAPELHPESKEVHLTCVESSTNITTYSPAMSLPSNVLKGVGVLSREDAISFGCTGGTGRASGWACDVRKRMPYGVYDKVDFKEIVYTEGDSFARYMVRMDEIMESLNIIEQLIDNIPEGPIQEKMKPIIGYRKEVTIPPLKAAAVNSECSSRVMATRHLTVCTTVRRGCHWFRLSIPSAGELRLPT